MQRDEIDSISEAWAQEEPGLDLSRSSVALRLLQAASLLKDRIDRAALALGLDEGQWGVLAALRRSGPPYRLTPGELCRTTLCSSAGMTKRLDRLERAGLVTREADPTDRRGVLVAFTPAGLAVARAATEATFAVKHKSMSVLSAADCETLAVILRKLLAGLNEGIIPDPSGERDDEPGADAPADAPRPVPGGPN